MREGKGEVKGRREDGGKTEGADKSAYLKGLDDDSQFEIWQHGLRAVRQEHHLMFVVPTHGGVNWPAMRVRVCVVCVSVRACVCVKGEEWWCACRVHARSSP